jgi:hypothetical protein
LVLVFVNFCVKYQNRDDFDYLVSSLSRFYQVKASPVATRFLGFTLDHNRAHRTLTLSYPGYIDAMLFHLRPLGVTPAASPSLYVPPHYGSSDPQRPTSDSSPPATPAQKQELQIAIGYLLYYGRCVNGRVLPATCALASVLTTATQRTMMELERVLGFVVAHRDGRKIFHPSDMLLDILTDASYLSRPKAGSVGWSFHHLTRGNDPDFINC